MASKSEIIDAIEALAAHFRPPLMSIEVKAAWTQDWCSDLAEFPIEAIQAAAKKWRQTGEKFPTAGKFIPLVRGSMPDPNEGPKVDVWRPLTDEEYAALTIREKIRHQTILAHEAGNKAGPMWSNPEGANMKRPVPGHIAPEAMPPAHRHWRQIADGHTAEAKRLREIINQRQAEA